MTEAVPVPAHAGTWREARGTGALVARASESGLIGSGAGPVRTCRTDSEGDVTKWSKPGARLRDIRVEAGACSVPAELRAGDVVAGPERAGCSRAEREASVGSASSMRQTVEWQRTSTQNKGQVVKCECVSHTGERTSAVQNTGWDTGAEQAARQGRKFAA